MLLAVSDSGSHANGELASAFPHLRFESPSQGEIHVESDAPISAGSLVRFLEERGIEVTEARRLRPSLEEVGDRHL